jgi:hypothetical protein
MITDGGGATVHDRGGVVLVVDAANVVGSRPDGWWRDRAGAASRLLTALAPLTGTVVSSPEGEPLLIRRIVAVVEGQARNAEGPADVEVVRAPHDGDSAIVTAAREVVAAGEPVLVVTADRGLRARLPLAAPGGDAGSAAAAVAGPRWLLDLL